MVELGIMRWTSVVVMLEIRRIRWSGKVYPFSSGQLRGGFSDIRANSPTGWDSVYICALQEISWLSEIPTLAEIGMFCGKPTQTELAINVLPHS